MRLSILPGALCAGLVAGVAPAASLPGPYTGLVVLGDSLSDTGNLFARDGIPVAPYVDGRFSNGDVWADAVIADFAAAGLPAIGLAHGLASATTDTLSVDRFEQMQLLTSLLLGPNPVSFGARPLAALWFGANDVFGAVDAGLPTPVVQSVASTAAALVGDSIVELAGLGFGDFLLFNLPDLGRTPAYALIDADLADEATAGSDAFNAAIAAQAAGLRAAGLTVTEIDIAGLFDSLLANPGDFGVSDATNPCYLGDVLSVISGLVPGCTDDEREARVFFDSVHPNSIIQAEIAAQVRGALAPVPLPPAAALFGVALGGLGLLARRR